MAGTFLIPPFKPFHWSGIGVVPKQDGSLRVIIHFLAPNSHSINDSIDPKAVTLTCTSVDQTISMATKLGRGTLFAKMDLKHAFQQCSVWPADRHLLKLCWKGQYFYEKCFPFGLQSSLFLFNTASAVEYIFKHSLAITILNITYMASCLPFSPFPPADTCRATLEGTESLCDQPEKCPPPQPASPFLALSLTQWPRQHVFYLRSFLSFCRNSLPSDGGTDVPSVSSLTYWKAGICRQRTTSRLHLPVVPH